MLSIIMLNVVILNVIMLHVANDAFMLSVVVLSVVAPSLSLPWTNIIQQDITWLKFSTLEVTVCFQCISIVIKQNCLT